MKTILPAALLGMIFLSSCSTMYKTGQTPDDVYFSPTRPASETVKKDEDTRDEYTYTEPDDNYLRMKVQNPNRWNTINDADYWYSYNRPYQYTNSNYTWDPTWSYGYNSYYPTWNNNYNYGYNYYGNPYYYNHGYYGYQPGTIVRNLHSNTGPKPYMGGYTNTQYNNRNNTYNSGTSGKNSSSLGNTLRNVFTPSTTRSTTTTSTGETYSNPVRSFTPSTPSQPSSSSGSNSSSGRSSSTPSSSSSTSRPGRGGN